MTATQITEFFSGRVPKEWFQESEIDCDDDEILVVGVLPTGADVGQFRETTRSQRMTIAEEAQHVFGRKVSWGVRADSTTIVFTSLSTPVMTRLRIRERAVLDTLIDAGVARSRSEALAWCVKLVGRHQSEWLSDLREALSSVQQIRSEGPSL